MEAAHACRVGLERFRHLNGQFPRGAQHQCLGAGLRQIDFRQNRQCKRGGLAGARLCHADNVFALQQHGNRGLLDRRRLFIPHLAQGVLQELGQIELSEAEFRTGTG